MRRISAVMALFLFTSGCSTFSETFDRRSHCAPSLVYCGTRVDAQMIAAASDESAGLLRIFLPMAIIDLPISLAADTIILPYTIYRDATSTESKSPDPVQPKGDGSEEPEQKPLQTLSK